jgi:SAM-dependent methyltransferase
MMDLWQGVRERFERGDVCRDRIFHDLILDDASRLGRRPAIVDIGCGRGLDGDLPLQRSIGAAASHFIGVDPDPAIEVDDTFTESHPCLFEDAPLTPSSIDLAYAAMVLEHIPEPQRFWDKLHEVLTDGGIFWGMTVDGRHPFCRTSLWLERLRVKDLYLHLLFGRRGLERYENYPTFYRTNTPEAVGRLGRAFHDVDCLSLTRLGLWSCHYPPLLRPLVDAFDRRRIRHNQPGILLLIRAAK